MPTLTEVGKINVGHATEINFIIEQFSIMSPEEQQDIFDKLQTGVGHINYAEAGCKLVSFLRPERPEGKLALVSCINRRLAEGENVFTDYEPGLDSAAGAALVARYFKNHLVASDNGFSIEEVSW